MDVAGRAAKEFSAAVMVIKKNSAEYTLEKGPPPCPSVLVNGRFIARNDTVSYAAIKTTILSESEI